MFNERILFGSGEHGYHAFRIPVLSTTNENTLLAFCEARKGKADDYGKIDILLRRKEKGKEWSEPTKVVGDGLRTYHNPCVINDGNKVHLLYGIEYLQIFHAVSYDDGKTFVEHEEITSVFPDVPFTAVAVGPGTGVNANGKLLTPVWIAMGGANGHPHACSFIGVLYSENGKEWKFKSVKMPGVLYPNESQIATLSNGDLVMTVRHCGERHNRVKIFSSDGINWSEPIWEENITEQTCMASILGANGKVLFSNPAYNGSFNGWVDRREVTVRLSEDDTKTWRYARKVTDKWSGYSHLANRDETYYLLYETNLGEQSKMDLVLAEFDEKWIKGE